jgi:hypothetical protein
MASFNHNPVTRAEHYKLTCLAQSGQSPSTNAARCPVTGRRAAHTLDVTSFDADYLTECIQAEKASIAFCRG